MVGRLYFLFRTFRLLALTSFGACTSFSPDGKRYRYEDAGYANADCGRKGVSLAVVGTWTVEIRRC